MNVPNLAAMSHDDLMAFWSRYHRATRKDAAELIGDCRKGYTSLAGTLANLACNMAVAMSCRAKGDRDGAAIYDYSVALCFDRLPEDIRARITPRPVKATTAPEPKPIGHPFNPNR
jgi:hypothetical protein